MPRRIIRNVKGYLSPKKNIWYVEIVINFEDDNSTKGRDIKWKSTGIGYPGNKREAQKKMEKLVDMYKIYMNKRVDPDITIADFVPYFLEQREPYLRKGTWEGYKLKSKHIVDYFGNTKLIELTRKQGREFYNYLLTEGKIVNKKTGQTGALAWATVTDIKNLFCQMIDFAVEDELLEFNPIQRMKLGKGGKSKKQKELLYMEFERAQEFIRYLLEIDEPLSDFLIAFLNFGLRRSEGLGLTKENVDLEAEQLRIRRTVTRVTSIHDEEDTKSAAGMRDFHLSTEEVKFFERVLAKKEQYREFFGNSYVESDFIFTWADGRPFRPDYVTKRTKKILTNFGEPNLTVHSLRHSYASILYEKGVDLKEAQYLMGHGDSSVTLQIYIHIGRKKKGKGHTELELN